MKTPLPTWRRRLTADGEYTWLAAREALGRPRGSPREDRPRLP